MLISDEQLVDIIKYGGPVTLARELLIRRRAMAIAWSEDYSNESDLLATAERELIEEGVICGE